MSFENFGIELSSQEVPLQVLSSIYNVSQLSSRWISVGPLNTPQRPLSCVQYLVLYLSRIQRICHSRYLNLYFSIARTHFCVYPRFYIYYVFELACFICPTNLYACFLGFRFNSAAFLASVSTSCAPDNKVVPHLPHWSLADTSHR
jgi:hypothetical protein